MTFMQRTAAATAPGASITCKCGEVKIAVKSRKNMYRLDCCCYDCTSCAWYWEKKGLGPEPLSGPPCEDLVYFANDFTVEKGMSSIGAMKPNKERDATRFYCKKCYTMLMTDHPFYGALMFSTPIMNYKSFKGLDADLTETDSRQFLNDLTPEERKNVPEWKGPAEHNYDGVTGDLLAKLGEGLLQKEGSTGDFNIQKLLQAVGGEEAIFYPEDEAERMKGGPMTFMQRTAAATAPGAAP